MIEANPEELEGLRSRFLDSIFGPMRTWSVPAVQRTVGPWDMSVYQKFDEKRRQLVQDCTAVLQHFGHEDLVILTNPRAADPNGLRESWGSAYGIKVKELERACPSWMDGGFGHPDHVADFEGWSRMNHFSFAEITCLSVGIAPDEFPGDILEQFQKLDKTKMSETTRYLLTRHEQVTRKFQSFRSGLKVLAADFLAWADTVRLEVHPEFMAPLRKYHSVGASAPVAVQANEGETARTGQVDRREVDMIAQLFTAMAIDHLGYVRESKRSPIPKEIVELAATMGLSVSEETVRKYLRIGARHIPPDWKPKIRNL